MGIIARQAFWNAASIVSATLIGAINTIIILPKAFNGFEEGWGLIGLMISAGLVYSPFLALGASHIIIRFYESHLEKNNAANFLGFAILIPILGISIFIAIYSWLGADIFSWMARDQEDIKLVEKYTFLFLVLIISWTGFYSLSGYAQAIYKTSFYQMLNELGLKGSYFILALLYWGKWINFEQMLIGYGAIYVFLFSSFLIFSIRHGFRISFNWKNIEKRGIAVYGLYSILDRGAAILVNRLDILMIGVLMNDLANIAFYTLAFYIGSVVLIPQKSILLIANPIASKSIQTGDFQNLKDVYQKSALNQLIVGGLIFMLIWTNIDAIMSLLPDKFQGGKWVVFYIGVSKLFLLMSGVNGGIIVYSKYYRANLVINLLLVILSLFTNLWLIPLYGLDGAALATAISLFVYAAIKTIYVNIKFQIHQLTQALIITCVLLIIMSIGGYFIHLETVHAFWEIIIKGSISSIIFVGLVLLLRLSPDIEQFLVLLWKKIYSAISR